MIMVTEPIESDLNDIVIRLGGFHMEMSFLRAVGHLMVGSGLQELLETIYAPNAVVHMLSGKAISRAVRAHLIVDAALNVLISARAFGIPVPECEDTEVEEVMEKTARNADLEEVSVLYENLMQGLMCADQVCQSDVVYRINDALEREGKSLKSSRTATLWLQYIEMVGILRKYIRAERTGNWELHLQTLSDMLPYLAASGHNNYTKSVLVYLQQMHDLQDKHPDVYEHFKASLHIVRRSDHHW